MKRPSTYLRMQVLGAVENAEGKTRRQRMLNAANCIFTDEEGNKYKFTWRTISTWYYRYKVSGITGIESKKRKDKGLARKTSPEEVLEAINEVRKYFKAGISPTKSAIYRMCIEKGFLRKELIAPTTFYRFVREHDLLDQDDQKSTRRMAFSMQYANDLWQADTMFGPYIKHNGKSVQSKLIAFIDDASRVICHGQFFPAENVDTLMDALKSALYKRGVPKAIYVDNGSIYCSAELNLVCARIGCILRHTPVRDGASKGKIERFFRTVREQFLIRNLDISSLDKLNQQFFEWVENEYNSRRHSILGMTPLDRFFVDRRTINYLSPCDSTDELFYMENERKVAKDNTFRFTSKRYETPVELAGKTISIRYPRLHMDKVIVYYKSQRMGEAKEVDLIANARAIRPKKDGVR